MSDTTISQDAKEQKSELDRLQQEAEQFEDKKNKIKSKKVLTGVPFIIISVVAVAGVMYQFYNAGFGVQSEIQLRSIHWIYISFISFLIYPTFGRLSEKLPRFLNKGLALFSWVLAIASAASGVYIYVTWPQIAARLGYEIPREVYFGVITIILVLELVRRVVGMPLVITIGVFIAYAFLGPYMPGPFQHRGIAVQGLVRTLYISTDGIFGLPMGISASYVILFIIFGSFLQESGGGKLFTDLAFGMVGKTTGGPAKAAVVSSGLMGMISGAAVANVVTTGTFTIPLMKKNGYKPETAGAVEAVASTGGQIMPPVMGAAAFLMAEMCGVPYGRVAVSALFLALLYYLYLFVCVHLEAKKLGIKGLGAHMLPSAKQALKERGHLLIPLVVLIVLLVRGQSPGKSIFWSTVMIIVIGALRKNTRMGPKQIVNAMRNGVTNALPVAAACAGAGIITGIILITGIGLRFSSILIAFSGGSLLLMLIMTMVAAIILGMGLPTSACYAILSVLTAPALIRLGIPPLASHYFIFFFGCISTITPPVALSSYAASGIAETDPMRTSWVAFRLGLVGFIIPFLAVYKPGLLLLDTPLNIIANMVFSIVAVVALTFSMQGMLYRKLNALERLLFVVPSLVIFFPTSFFIDLAATGIAAVGFLLARRGRPMGVAA